jgi:hypothetical protein
MQSSVCSGDQSRRPNAGSAGNPLAVIRFAETLNLRINGMSPRQVARLIYWRITRRDMQAER